MNEHVEIREVFVVVMADDEMLMGVNLTPTGQGHEAEAEFRFHPDCDKKGIRKLLKIISEELTHIIYLDRVEQMVQGEIEKQSFDEGAAFDVGDVMN